MFNALGFDYDGTLADSRETAFAVAEEIAGMFGVEARIMSMTDYRLVFDDIERRCVPEPENAEVLRALHRLLMRARAAYVPLFEPVLALAGQVVVETAIITSGLRETALGRIGGRIANVRVVLGHQDGLKEHNLAAWSSGRHCGYVTDNTRDIKHCRSCGVAVIAVGWGFDTKDDLLRAGPDWFVGDTTELKTLMVKLNLIT
jgi:phosphoglycolate phosphatase-like HAD superfamily hydrolase